MRRVFLLLSACLVMSLAFASAAGAQAIGQVLGCEDFATQQDAQITLNAGTGDLSLIDADADGVACENFDYGAADGGATAAPVEQQAQQTNQQSSVLEELSERCAVFGSGFGTQLDAQEFYENNPADFALVDPNGDGQVCTADDFTFAQEQSEQDGVAAGSEATPTGDQYAGEDSGEEMTALPDTGGPVLLPIAVGLVALGIGGLLLKRRLS